MSRPSNTLPRLSPEADGHYFVGYMLSQLQRYDEAIVEFDKALAAFPFHASAEFGIARAYQRKGDLKSAREHLARFQKITAEHLGTPFGAGYGDQGRYSLAELARSAAAAAPPAIAVSFKEQPLLAATAGQAGGICTQNFRAPARVRVFSTTTMTASRIYFSSAPLPMAPAGCCTTLAAGTSPTSRRRRSSCCVAAGWVARRVILITMATRIWWFASAMEFIYCVTRATRRSKT